MEQTEIKPWKPWQIILLIAGILLFGWYILQQSNSSSNTIQPAADYSSATTQPATAPAERKWTKVITFHGNGRKNSPTFHLTGQDSKIVYSYVSASDAIGVLYIYVVEKGRDIYKTGGIPDVSSSSTSVKKEESTLQKSEGDYYLSVNAAGDWKVQVFQMQ